ncbi:MAG: 50S ribosomal protein L11 methyltransferase [Bacillota bacterium]|uniref:Ribosomal protein L11 methyltransferase n=1 Tax=Thermanaerosceptrum fracticalcis TaxID=1712410 RepID=A0A7G6E254_THEFR|nr:50S ribosomal protein L11 methyltransferase [Thermanaerosceptrum fracticalcis]QNB46158.1 50S ribosomal protein L11 methyltransferase [Thermanaerosceptrum fracticalcis]
MEWQEISISTVPEAVEAISDIFYELGSGGVVIEDPELVKAMAGSGQWDAYELPEDLLNRPLTLVKGYLPVDDRLPGKLEELRAEVAEIMSRLDQPLPELIISSLNEEDWANSWKAYFKPVKIGERVVVCPSWERYEASEEDIVLDLDPGMAFGTGTHATTAMCVRFLEQYVKKDDTVLDVGTGTGILAMCAARLGASQVKAFDYDPTAVKVAAENIKKNNLDDKIQVQVNDLLAGITDQADLIVANIIADIIIKLFPQAKTNLKENGIFITSGIIGERRDDVVHTGLDLGFELVEESCQEDWVALVWQK